VSSDETAPVGGLTANTDAILGTAGWIEAIAEDFDNDVQAVMRAVRRLMERWKGRAGDSHSDAWTDWHNSANNLIGALEDDVKALRAAAYSYVHTDSGMASNVHDAGGGETYEVNI
jgi:WXG100 family type VII secretion target